MKSPILSNPEPKDVLIEPVNVKAAKEVDTTKTAFDQNKNKIISFLRGLLITMMAIVVIFSLLITKMLFSPNPNPWLLFGMIAIMVLPMIIVMSFLFRFLVNYIKISKEK